MTGLPGRPMRAGASVVDILRGLFGAIGVVAALFQRTRTAAAQIVRSALLEAGAFLMAQHMQQLAVTGSAPPPMSQRNPAWGIYDIFDTADGEHSSAILAELGYAPAAIRALVDFGRIVVA